MSNLEKYTQAFVETFDVSAEEAQTLKYQDIKAWDSVGHMGLVTALEDAFDIMLETEDIIEMSSFAKGKEILEANYEINFSV